MKKKNKQFLCLENMCLCNIALLSLSLPPTTPSSPSSTHTSSGVLHIMVQGRALSFVSAVIGWDELSCVSVPITSSSEGCGKREVPGRRRGRKVEREMCLLLLPEILISLRRRPLSQYSRNKQHQRGSVWHTGKVILTAGVSLEWTNHCFTWLNRVQERRSREQEQSLISYRVMKAKWLIHWTKILHLYACK